MNDSSHPARIYTDEALAELCLGATARIERALDSGDHAASEACLHEIIAAKRGFCAGYLDWLVLTYEYILEEFGHEEHARATSPERTAELAVRAGVGLEDLVSAQALVAGDDNEHQATVRQAMATGDRQGALEAWAVCERLFRASHDLRRDAISSVLGFIYTEHGADALRAAQLHAAARGPWGTYFPAERELEAAERLRALTFQMGVGSYSRLSVTEEHDRWVIHQLLCGTCGRQVIDRYAGSDAWRLPTVTGAGPLTLGTPALTVYQTHLAIIHSMFAIDAVGAPWPAIQCAGLKANRCSCDMFIYKDPADTPAELYEVVGMTKTR